MMNGSTYLTRSTDEEVLEDAEYGGAVTSLLIYALESGRVDKVVGVEAVSGNRYEAVPVMTSDIERVKSMSGSLHCATPNIARFVKEYLDGIPKQKIAVTCKPCDARAIIELVKREQIEPDNILLVGLNCTGTISPVTAKKMYENEFGCDHRKVIREEIEEGELTVTLEDGTKKTRDLTELEEKGYGRRENCRRCDMNIPNMADLACGKWGNGGEKLTFIEVCSEEGSDLLESASEEGYVSLEEASEEANKERRKKNEEEIERAEGWQRRAIEWLDDMRGEERLDYWMKEFNNCIKCYGCRDACPICYCKDCILEADRDFVEKGEIPPDTMFPLTRLSHVADSCVNCGQCQDACPMELPLSKLYTILNYDLMDIFEYVPGMDTEEPPPLSTATEKELQIEDTFLDVRSLSEER